MCYAWFVAQGTSDDFKVDFAAMLRTVERDIARIAAQRDGLDRLIAEKVKMRDGLRLLCEPLPKEPPVVTDAAQSMLQHAGLTDAVRMYLQAKRDYASVSDVITGLETVRYPLSRMDNPRAAIVVILSRLVSKGDVERKEVQGDEVQFRWTDPRTLSEKIADQMLNLQRLTGETATLPVGHTLQKLAGLKTPKADSLSETLAKQFTQGTKKK
jgi:hypothetical protein